MKIRALCTDIDGTLLDSSRMLSSRTISVIRNLDNKIPIILASSRMPSAMRHLQQDLGILNHPLICYNGGYVLYMDRNSLLPIVIDSVQIPAAICLSILEKAEDSGIHISLYAEDQWYAPANDQWAEREERITKVSPIITNLHKIIKGWLEKNTGAHKVMCMGLEDKIEEIQSFLSKKFPNDLHVYRSKSTYLEIAPRSVTKASALKRLLEERFTITLSEVMAFGDNYNDIELLRAAGLGIAVENAREEVKAVAKEITLNNKEDGVAIAIEKYVNSIQG